ncbi:MAG: trigger factor [Firmicutes bacterium]|nr:trigger factor [Bacillota bacterium]
MESNLTKLENNRVSLEVIASPQEVEAAVTAACRQIGNKLSIPGFRPGRIPRHIIEQRVGRDFLYQEAMEGLVSQGYLQALQEHKLHPVAEPELEIEQKLEEEKEFVFKAEVEVLPEVKLGEYKGLQVKKETVQITDERVEEEIRRLQQQYAELVTVEKEKPEKGDFVLIDFDGYIDEEPFPGGAAQGFLLEIGAGRFFPEFEKELQEMRVGEEKEIKVDFPEDLSRPDLAGKNATFKVTLHEIKVRELPAIDDEFAKSLRLGENVAELQEAVRKGLQSQAEHEAERAFQRAVVEQVVAGSEVAVSETLLQREVDHLLHEFEHDLAHRGIKLEQYLEGVKKSKEEFIKELRPTAEKKIKTELVLFSIADKEGITVTEEEINERKEVFRLHLEKMTKRDRQRQEELLTDGIRTNLLKEKIIHFLVEKAEPVLVEENGKAVEK